MKFIQSFLAKQKLHKIIHKRALWRPKSNILLIPYIRHMHKWNEMLMLLFPRTSPGLKMVRIGGANDGGYVMPDPGRDGVALSLGVSLRSPWDLEMAERGFTVYQYDGTIEDHPDDHPNLVFTRANVGSGSNLSEGWQNITDIISTRLPKDKEAILQIDIEGSEWDVFDAMSSDEMKRFRQIIVEFHGVRPDSPYFKRAFAVMLKLDKTHAPVHLHFNNYSGTYWFPDYTYGVTSLEVSYLRREMGMDFQPSGDSFPCELDEPCAPDMEDVPVGTWEQIKARFDEIDAEISRRIRQEALGLSAQKHAAN